MISNRDASLRRGLAATQNLRGPESAARNPMIMLKIMGGKGRHSAC